MQIFVNWMTNICKTTIIMSVKKSKENISKGKMEKRTWTKKKLKTTIVLWSKGKYVILFSLKKNGFSLTDDI